MWQSILILGALAFLALLWWMLGLGPRRTRRLRATDLLLKQGRWADALKLLRSSGRMRGRWRPRFDEAEAACLEVGMNLALKEKNFDQAHEHALRMASLRGLAEASAHAQIQAAMLEEMRRLFATGNTRAVNDLAARPLLAGTPETSFWLALCCLREGQVDQAMARLQASAGGTENWAKVVSSFLDPPLYLGALLLRRGQPKEALRLLTEANRIDSTCPIVTVLLGSAIVATGGDSLMAARALKKALGTRGLAQWADNPERAWIEAYPPDHSYVRKLAEKQPFICPLWGGDLKLIVRQGNLALAQSLERLGQFPEASELFNLVLQEGAPSALVLRGLGVSLARIGKYDDAFKHLRIAHEMEEPKDRLTAGYLALCGAHGKPSKPEDKLQNIVWAIRLVTQFNAPKDAEWVGIVADLFAQGRENHLPQSLDDQLYLCEHLTSIEAVDGRAAAAYEHLQTTFPQALRPEYAWLYCRAATGEPSPVRGRVDSVDTRIRPHTGLGSPDPCLDLFAATFAQEAEARAFFTERKWDFDAVEFLYLSLASVLAPGSFPASLGPDYPARGEVLLLARSVEQEKTGQLPAALVTTEILDRLAPHRPPVLDRLACLHYRLEQTEQTQAVLQRWQELHPADPVPLMRQAVFLYKDQNAEEGERKLRRALELSQGRQRADVGFLSARLALHHGRSMPTPKEEANARPQAGFTPEALATAQDFLQESVRSEPGHALALECLAAVRWLRGDSASLSAQAGSMHVEPAEDQRFRYFAALCHWAGHDATATMERLRTPGADKRTGAVDIGLESSYLEGLAHCRREDWASAQSALEPVARSADSPSASLAQAYLGAVCFAQEKYAEAEHWWQKLDARKRAGWQLAEPLSGTALLSALTALYAGRFEEAAELFRTAGKLGCRDRRLGPMLILSLFRAGQHVVYSESRT